MYTYITISTINTLLEEIELKYVRKMIKNHLYWCLERINKDDLSYLESNNLCSKEHFFFQNDEEK